MYVPLPNELLRHIHPKLYFPYFGSLATATHATFGINCGPREANYDSLGVGNLKWDVTFSESTTEQVVSNPSIVKRPSYYFVFGYPSTPEGLGHPNPDGFWSFFNCGVSPIENPFHRAHYFGGSLAHIDAIPWATYAKWSDVEVQVRFKLKMLASKNLQNVISVGKNISTILVRGRSQAEFLESCGLGLSLCWNPTYRNGYEFGTGMFDLDGRRRISVIAYNQFNNLPSEIAPELLKLIQKQS